MVTILAVLAVAGGAFMIVSGSADASGGSVSSGTLAEALPWVTVAVGAAWLVAAWNFWTLGPSGWLLGMGATAATFLVAVLNGWNEVGPSPVVLFGLAIVATYCLLSPAVRQVFSAEWRRRRGR